MLAGSIDGADRRRLRGWVRDTEFPDAAVTLLVTADGRLLERVVANRHRPDLERAGLGRGRHAFEISFNPPLSPVRSWLVHVRSEADGADMPGSPLRLEASSAFDDAARQAFAASLASFATDAELGVRLAFLAEQRQRLLQHRADLQSSPPAAGPGQPGVLAPRRALVIDEQAPDPDRDAGSRAILSHMQSLQRLGYAVSFTSPFRSGTAGPEPRLESAGIEVCQAPWFASVEEVLSRQPNTFNVVYLHRGSVAAAYMLLARQHQPAARLVYCVADLHHLQPARQSEVENRPELMAEARRLRTQEVWAAGMADAVITHSSIEAGLLQPSMPPGRIHVIAWSVPARPRAAPFTERSGLAFIGNYRHAPNVGAAHLLRDEVMPAVLRADPAITCRLVGANLPASLQQPAAGMDPVGHAARLDDVFDQVRLTVAPLSFGAGLKGKVLDSLAAGVPCVCSPVAAEGLDLPARLRRLVVTDTAQMARAIIRLHTDERYNARMSEAALAFASEAFSEARLDLAMRAAVGLARDREDAQGIRAAAG